MRFPFLAKTGFFSRVSKAFFFVFFFEAFFHVVFQRFFLDFGGVLKAKIGAKTSFGSVFCDVFLEGSLGSIFLCF